MSATFQSSALTTLYNGSGDADLQKLLNRFRTGAELANIPDLDVDIDNLDKRIAMFESVLFSVQPNNGGNANGEYPYDKEGMRREFLDEVAALLIRRSVDATAKSYVNNRFVTDGVLFLASTEYALGELLKRRQGEDNYVIGASSGYNNFADLAVTATSDQRRNMLNGDGRMVYDLYAQLIDQVFQEGEKLALNPSRNVEVTSAIPPLTIEGFAYERIANENDMTTTPPKMRTYLVESDAPLSSVVKDATGTAQLTGSTTTSAQRLLLEPKATSLSGGKLVVAVDNDTVEVTASATNLFLAVRPSTNPVTATPIKPFRMVVPGKEGAFPSTYLEVTHRVVGNNGVPYLLGTSSEGTVYVISVASAKRTSIGATATLSSIEYLYFFNETRIKILRAKLSYNEAVVREIQDDLKRANEALADLEARSGIVNAQDKDGNLTYQYSAETFKMNLFNATNSPAGQPLFSEAGTNSLHEATDWQENRTNLKNYIDRRSAEAQQATLDYQNVLNRYNNAFEVMGKLQEKIDTLLKAQLRNMS
jgi:hypothetical protein